MWETIITFLLACEVPMQPTSTSCYTSNPFSLFSTVQYLFSVFSSNGLFSPPLSVGSRQARSGRGRRERKGINNWHERPLTSFLPLSLPPPPSGGVFCYSCKKRGCPDGQGGLTDERRRATFVFPSGRRKWDLVGEAFNTSKCTRGTCKF